MTAIERGLLTRLDHAAYRELTPLNTLCLLVKPAPRMLHLSDALINALINARAIKVELPL